METNKPLVRFACSRTEGGFAAVDAVEYEPLYSGSD